MPANTKPVPWNEIKRLYEAGKAANAIAKDMTAQGDKISKQAILKRAGREGWKVNPSAVKVRGVATAWEEAELPPTATGNQLMAGPSRSATQIANWGRRTPENAVRILTNLAEHGDIKLAAQAAGIHPDTLKRWRESDADFAGQVESAQAQFLQTRLGNVVRAGDRGDWKADQWLLSKNEVTKDTYGEVNSGGTGGITVNLKFDLQRGAIPRDEDIIEIEAVSQ